MSTEVPLMLQFFIQALFFINKSLVFIMIVDQMCFEIETWINGPLTIGVEKAFSFGLSLVVNEVNIYQLSCHSYCWILSKNKQNILLFPHLVSTFFFFVNWLLSSFDHPPSSHLLIFMKQKSNQDSWIFWMLTFKFR